ncbi:MAG: choice-of-anchor V domain-containing protein, partial [Flavobacterium sp.]
MKKNYFYLLLLLPFVGLLFTSSSGGFTSGSSGSTGDSGNTCTQCHSGGNFSASLAISSTVPAGGYALNTTYSVTVTLTSSPNSTRSGFQITAENASNTKVGTFTAGTGSQTINNNRGVTHDSTGNSQKTWTFNWTSPATDQGAITFYASGNATNNNGNTTGDQVVTATRLIGNVLSNQEFGLATFKMFPNPSTDVLNISLPEGYNQATAMV